MLIKKHFCSPKNHLFSPESTFNYQKITTTHQKTILLTIKVTFPSLKTLLHSIKHLYASKNTPTHKKGAPKKHLSVGPNVDYNSIKASKIKVLMSLSCSACVLLIMSFFVKNEAFLIF